MHLFSVLVDSVFGYSGGAGRLRAHAWRRVADSPNVDHSTCPRPRWQYFCDNNVSVARLSQQRAPALLDEAKTRCCTLRNSARLVPDRTSTSAMGTSSDQGRGLVDDPAISEVCGMAWDHSGYFDGLGGRGRRALAEARSRRRQAPGAYPWPLNSQRLRKTLLPPG